MKKKLFPFYPVCAAQLVGVKGSEDIIKELRGDKLHKCPCKDGAGSGTKTINDVKYLCDGCDGNGYTSVLMKCRQEAIAKGVMEHVIEPA